jgi:predicted ATP-grasp superfamily ATP-dependent carboligase
MLKTATNAARVAVPTNLPVVAPAAAANTNGEISALIRLLGANTNLIASVRQQFWAGSPEAAARYDEIVNGLLNGRMNLDDLHRQAGSCASQLRELKRDLGPEAGDAIDAYLSVLENFLKETAPESTNATTRPKSSTP